MPNLFLSFTINKFFSFLFMSALVCALFYTGIEIWQYTVCFILLTLNMAIVFQQRYQQPMPLPTSGIFVTVTLLLTWYVASVFFSPIKYLSVHNFFGLGSIFIIFLLFTFHNNKDKIWSTLWPLILLLVFIWAIWGLVQYYYLHVASNASFLDRNTLAALINLVLIPASGYFLLNKEQRPALIANDKVLSLILFILFLTTFIITSRAGSLSLILGFVILLILLRGHIARSKYMALFTIIGISFLFSHLSQYFISSLPSDFTERMISLKNLSEAGNPRFIIWKSVLPLFNDMPWYGFGLGSFWLFWAPYRPVNDDSAGFFAHNDYLQMTIEVGYPGILLLSALFLFILLGLIRTLKNKANADFSLVQRVELISLFAALITYAAHSFFTYIFYVLPLLLIAGLYLARFNQLSTQPSTYVKTLPALKSYFSPITFSISLGGTVIILCGYFITELLSGHYNNAANQLMLQKQYEIANETFLKAQRLAPLMDNPYFSHANLLMNGGNRLAQANKTEDANSLFALAHQKLDQAEKLNPLRHQVFHIRGLLFEAKQPDKAIKQYEKALSLAPRFLPSRIQLAALLHKQKQLAQALKVLDKGLYYKYFASRDVITFLQLYATYSREAGNEKLAKHLENEIKENFNPGAK
jgi:O-antigen ligase/Tfp pilus assembly protein PilF